MDKRAKAARAAYMRNWRKQNREKVNEYSSRWRAENPEKVKQHTEKYWLKKAAEMELQRLCPICGTELKNKRADAVFCSDSCRVKNTRQKPK